MKPRILPIAFIDSTSPGIERGAGGGGAERKERRRLPVRNPACQES